MEKTHVTLLCDRTGSMREILADAQGAVNSFLDEQKLVEGECTLWLCEFDSPDYGHEEDWFTTVHDGPITDAKAANTAAQTNTIKTGDATAKNSASLTITQTADNTSDVTADATADAG